MVREASVRFLQSKIKMEDCRKLARTHFRLVWTEMFDDLNVWAVLYRNCSASLRALRQAWGEIMYWMIGLLGHHLAVHCGYVYVLFIVRIVIGG